MSWTDPEALDCGATCASNTNVPSFLKTWMRSLERSHTYTSSSWLILAQWTGLPNCFGKGAPGWYRNGVSSGLLPYAPQCRLYLPVVASNTITRRLTYPSAT